jgi:hypothetical protein|tara:strand:+ start:419 stop:580 length:162 start_codon:yes stop_codon:yes gene_type:complete
MVPHFEKWDEMDKGHTQGEWLIGMIETGGKERNMDIFRIDFATDRIEETLKIF